MDASEINNGGGGSKQLLQNGNDNVDRYDKDIDAAVRKSIGKYFPLGFIMKSGCNNPLTIHSSADSKLFRAIYAWISETLSVTTILDRSIKEQISKLVSESNQCPVCVVAHTMMETIATNVEQNKKREVEVDVNIEQKQKQKEKTIIDYANFVLVTLKKNRNQSSDKLELSVNNQILDNPTKAEVAMVVLLFDYMNRVVSAIMGEEMSTAMFGMPRIIAKSMEQPSMISVMSRWMSSFLAAPFKVEHLPGKTTRLLFIGDDDKEENDNGYVSKRVNSLPDHLHGLKIAGLERANAVGRLMEWINVYEKEESKRKNFISNEVIAIVDQIIQKSRTSSDLLFFSNPGKVLKWIGEKLKQVPNNEEKDEERNSLNSELQKLTDIETGRVIIALLLLLSFVPKAVYQSSYWKDAIGRLGSESKARCVIFWWSLRITFQDAAGLNSTLVTE